MKRIKKAVILCAGLGTRLMPLTAALPKVMIPVQGRPLLQHHIDWLRGFGIEEFYINLHAHPDRIREYLGDGSAHGIRVRYSYESSLRGTAGALHGFSHSLGETFLLHYGDVFSQLDVDEMAETHRLSQAIATLAVHPSSHPEDSDIVECEPSGRIRALHSKPGSRRFGVLGNAACYLLEPEILEFLDPNTPSEDFTRDVFPRVLVAGQRLQAYHNHRLMLDLGTRGRYSQIERILSSQ